MAFEVLITDEALADLDAITAFIKRESTIDIAREWFVSIVSAIDTLKEMPGRCPLMSETVELGAGIRLLLHGRKSRAYKIYFRIQETASGGFR